MKPPKGKPREIPPAGVHQGALIAIIDIGTQPANKPGWSDSRKIFYNFELMGPGLKTEEGNPFFVRAEYTFSEKSKNLLRDLKAWKGIKDLDFDFDDLLGQVGAVTVVHSEDGQYANFGGLTALMKGVKPLRPTSALTSFYINEEEGLDVTAFNALPEWIRNKIAATEEYTMAVAANENKKNKKKAPVKTEPKGKKK